LQFIKVIYYQLNYGLQKDRKDDTGPPLLDDSWLSTDSFLHYLCKVFNHELNAQMHNFDLLPILWISRSWKGQFIFWALRISCWKSRVFQLILIRVCILFSLWIFDLICGVQVQLNACCFGMAGFLFIGARWISCWWRYFKLGMTFEFLYYVFILL
jgi:hypothetical protein